MEGGGQAAMAALLILALGFFFAVAANSAWPAVVGIAGALISHACVVQPQRMRKQTEKFLALCKEHGATFREDISDPASGLFVALSEERATVLMSHLVSKRQVRDVRVNLNDVLNVELSIDQSTVHQTGPIAALSGAAVGGAVFGGAGAIVGSIAASQTGRGKIGRPMARDGGCWHLMPACFRLLLIGGRNR